IGLDERNQSEEHEHFHPAIKTRRIKPDRLHEEVEPLILREERPLGDVIVEVEPGILEWGKFAHIKRILARLDFVCSVVFDDHRPPCPTRHEDLAILLQDFRSYTYRVVTKGWHIGPIVVPGLVEPYGELAKQSVFTVFFDATLDQFFFCTLGVG